MAQPAGHRTSFSIWLRPVLAVAFIVNLARATWAAGGIIGSLAQGHPWEDYADSAGNATALAVIAAVLYVHVRRESPRG